MKPKTLYLISKDRVATLDLLSTASFHQHLRTQEEASQCLSK